MTLIAKMTFEFSRIIQSWQSWHFCIALTLKRFLLYLEKTLFQPSVFCNPLASLIGRRSKIKTAVLGSIKVNNKANLRYRFENES